MTRRATDEHASVWFRAAAMYNLIWGIATVAYPTWVGRVSRISDPAGLIVWQVVAMFVLLYALGYWWVSRDTQRHVGIVLIGFAGKVLGPVGFLWAVATGRLPVSFGPVIVTNDVIWLPAFALCLRDAARRRGSWARLVLDG
jgi:small multidrug resistance pump